MIKQKLLVLGLFGVLAGCGGDCSDVVCGPCGPALTVIFKDADSGASLTGGTIDHPHGSCDDSSGRTVCSLDPSQVGAGDVHFVAGVEGYESQNIEETIPASDGTACCDCGYIETTLELSLLPAS